MEQQIISFHYTLRGPEGQVIDKSEDTPMAFLSGAGQIIAGLESILVEMAKGDKQTVNVAAADAYGEYNDELVAEVERNKFPEEIEVGQQFATDPQGMHVVTVASFDDNIVKVDANHPLAGVDLEFDIEVTDTRAATEEEISHGHAHGEGGHQH